MVQGLPENPDKPIHKELLVIDSTIEKLFGILSENPHGILMFVNELNKLVSNLNRYGKGSDEAYWIEFFDGNQVKYERKSTSDYINIFRPYVSVVGGTQPGLLAKMFGGDKEASGFTSRFLKIFPDITSMPKWGREPMPVGVEEEWAAIISEVLHTHCEYDANGEIIPQILHFSKNAMNVLFKWEEHICSEWEIQTTICKACVEGSKPTLCDFVLSFMLCDLSVKKLMMMSSMKILLNRLAYLLTIFLKWINVFTTSSEPCQLM